MEGIVLHFSKGLNTSPVYTYRTLVYLSLIIQDRAGSIGKGIFRQTRDDVELESPPESLA